MAGIGVATLIDDVNGDGSLLYVGYFPKQTDSTNTSIGNCALKRVLVDGTTTSTQWASDDFDQIWDDRSSAIYS